MRKSVRKLVVVASVGAVASLALAAPAAAGNWGGSLTCPSSTVVAAHGTKKSSGPMTLTAAGSTWVDPTNFAGVHVLYGAWSNGTWSVSGDGATAGYGFCGS